MILLNVVWLVVDGCARTTCLIVSCSSIHRPNKTHKHVKTKRRTRQLLGHLGVQRVRLRGAVKDPLLPELGRARPPDHGRHALRDLVGAAGACIFAFGVWGVGVGGFGVRMCRYRVYVSDRIQPHKDTSPKPSEKRKRTLRRHGLRPLGVEELGAVLHPQRRLQVLGVHVLCFFSGSIGCVDGVVSVKEGQGSSQICPEALWGCTCTTTDKGSWRTIGCASPNHPSITQQPLHLF